MLTKDSCRLKPWSLREQSFCSVELILEELDDPSIDLTPNEQELIITRSLVVLILAS
jgi:hypothetical protein